MKSILGSLHISRDMSLASSGSSTGGRGGDTKTIISPNTSFGDIINAHLRLLGWGGGGAGWPINNQILYKYTYQMWKQSDEDFFSYREND